MADKPLHRIAKLLARAGVASRREVERMVAEGRVAVNDVVIDTPATLLPSLHGVTVDGAPVSEPEPARLFLFHKPAGVLTTERDPAGRTTIYDRLPKDLPRVVPVGRLDLSTEGLLLLTTDGGLKRQLELPASGVERVYRARAYGEVSQPQLEALIDGVEIEGIRYGSIDANIERRTGANVWIEMVLTEGKNREVRRVLEHLGLRVSRLIRTRYGPFVLGDLPVGGVGEVRAADLAAFRQSLKAGRPMTRLPQVNVGGTSTAARTPRAAPSTPERAKTPARAAASRTPAPARPAPRPAKTATPPAAPARSKTGEPEVTLPARPAKPPQRKAGWAKPKPKSNVKPRSGPKKPRA